MPVQTSRTDIFAVCRQIYEQTHALYERLQPQFMGRGHGIKILGSPPRERPDIMFIGYQPGGNFENDTLERRLAVGENWPEEWPPMVEFAAADWQLAAKMRGLFPIETLLNSVSLNAIFLRFPKAAIYRQTLNQHARRELESFCMASVRKMIGAMSPVRIVAIGFETADLFGAAQPVLFGERGNALAKRLLIEGVEATAIIHVTGARVSSLDLHSLRLFLASDSLPLAFPTEGNRHAPTAQTKMSSSSGVGVTAQVVGTRTSSADRTGRYVIDKPEAITARAANRADPRWQFYDAMLRLERLEDYYSQMGHLKVNPPTFKSSPRTAHTEMAWARKQEWLRVL